MQVLHLAQLREKIAESRNCDVYAFGAHNVVKLYRQGFDPAEIRLQVGLSQMIQRSDLPVPQVQPDVVRCAEDGRLGVVFQRVVGPTLLEMAKQRPGRVASLARLLAEQHRLVHRSAPVDGLRTLKDWMHEKIDEEARLTPPQGQALRRMLDGMPDGNAICHGDFGLQNVIVGPERPMLIDWANATRGRPLGDVARSWIMLRFNDHLALGQRLYCALLAALYLRHYLRGLDHDRREMQHWITLHAALRLRDLHSDAERAPLLAFLGPRLARA